MRYFVFLLMAVLVVNCSTEDIGSPKVGDKISITSSEQGHYGIVTYVSPNMDTVRAVPSDELVPEAGEECWAYSYYDDNGNLHETSANFNPDNYGGTISTGDDTNWCDGCPFVFSPEGEFLCECYYWDEVEGCFED